MIRIGTILLGAALVALASGCPGATKTGKTRKKARSSSSSRSEPEWPGTFTGPELSITIEAGKEDDQLEGTIVRGAQRFPFSGTTSDDELEGTFRAGEQTFPFKATLDDDALSLETGEGDDAKTYALKRKAARKNPLAGGEAGPQNPLAGGEAPAPATGGDTTPPSTPAGWRSFTHRGFSCRYPADWTTRAAGQDAAMLVPPDLARTAQGQQAELYLLRGVSSQGTKRADDPRAIQFFDQQMRQTLPAMRRTGEPQKLPRGGVRLTYAGKNPQTGKQVSASLRVLVLEGFAFMFFAIAESAQLEKRDETLGKIFASFAYQQPKNDDPRLVGAWRNTRTYMSGRFSSVTERYLLLTADGRCYGGGKFAASMEHTDSGGNVTGSTSVDSTDKKGWEHSGRWFASQRSLTLQWSNGNRELYGYYICDGKSLLLRQSRQQKKGGLLFERYR